MQLLAVAALAIAFLALTATASDEEPNKVSSSLKYSSIPPKSIVEVLGLLKPRPSVPIFKGFVSDEMLDDSDSYEDNNEKDSGNSDSEDGVLRKDEATSADETEMGVNNEFGDDDRVNGNDAGMERDGGVKDADAGNDQQNGAKKEIGNNDTNLQDMSLNDWERAHEGVVQSKKKLSSIASKKKDPWGRHGGWGRSSRRRSFRRWGSSRRSSRRSWFSRRRTARGRWLRRTRRASRSRGFWSRRRARSIRRRGGLFRRAIQRRGRGWQRRIIRARKLNRRRAARKRMLSRRRFRFRRLRRTSLIRKIIRRKGRFFRKRTVRRFVSRFLTVRKGQVTFNAEGNNNRKSRWYSRKPHVPGSKSGVTIGRGYDMGQKSVKGIITDLLQAGISKILANTLSKGAGLKGESATKFLEKNHLNNVEITEQQQKALFKISYARQEAEAKRLTTKYYKTKWSSLHPKIQEILIDLKFRGDLRPRVASAAQLALKAAVKQNNLKMFTEVLKSRSYWYNVPSDRFKQRVKFLEQKSR